MTVLSRTTHTVSCAAAGPPADGRPGIFAAGLFTEDPRDYGTKIVKKKVRFRLMLRLARTPQLLHNLPELATPGKYILVRRPCAESEWCFCSVLLQTGRLDLHC